MKKWKKMRVFAMVVAFALVLSGIGNEPQMVYADTEDVEAEEDVIFEEGYVSEDGKWDCTLVKHEYESDGEGRQIVEIALTSYRESVDQVTEMTIPEKMRVRRDEEEDLSEEYYVTRIESMDTSSTIKNNVAKVVSVILPQTVISIGGEAFSWMTNLREVKISPDTDEGIEQAVLESYWLNGAEIGYGAFYKCEKLTSVEVPSVIQEIGNNAFGKCERLQSINLPNGVTRIGMAAFAYCAFTEISLPESITEIGEGAFSGCEKLTAIEFPPELTELASNVVNGCEALTKITVPSKVTAIGDNAFDGCLNLAEITFAEDAPVETIGSRAFGYCESLTDISLPDTVTEMGNSTFYMCNHLATVKLPEELTSIPDRCFESCESLISVIVPNNVEEIGKDAFYQCKSLISVVVSDSVSRIDDYAFSQCRALRTVVIPKNTEMGYNGNVFSNCDLEALTIYTEDDSFVMEELDPNINFGWRCVPVHGAVSEVLDTEDGWRYMKDEEEGIKIVDYDGSLENLVIPEFEDAPVTSVSGRIWKGNTTIKTIQIPDTVTYIGMDAFNGCTGLTKINIPSALEYIGDDALKGCQPMKNTRLPENIRYIGANSFCGWTELEKVVIPADVERLGENAFNGCTKLESVEFKGVSETGQKGEFYIGDSAFQDCNLKSLTIPDNCIGMNSRAFEGNANLKTVVLPDNMYISDRAFSGCTSLESINLPSALPTVVEYVFSGCTSLSEITIPEGVETIYGSAFSGCSRLAKVTIPSKDTLIKKNAFDGCSSLTIYTVSDSDALRYAKEYSIPYVLLDGDNGGGGDNDNPGDNPGENPGENPSQNPGQNPGQNKGEDPNVSISCNKTVYNVTYGGKSFKINATSTGKLTFTSSSSKIAAVDMNSGVVTIKGTGIATITVKAGNKSVTVTVRVSPKKASLRSVKTVKGKKLKVKWAKDKKASGYQVQVSTDKNFKNKKNIKQKNVTKTSCTFPKLKVGKKYYVRVCSYKKSGKETLYGAWSSKKQSGKVKK